LQTKLRNFGLDAVRACAILMVLLAHGSKYFPSSWTQGFEDTYWAVGVIGVELFYALSGFLIGGILLNMQSTGTNWATIKNFMLRRWIRTLPLYYLVIIVLLAFPGLDPNPHLNVQSYFTLTQNLLSPMPGIWFGPSWSLTIEEWSYVALPLLAFVFFRDNRHAVIGSALVLIVLGLLWRLLFTDAVEAWDETTRKVVLTRIDAIAFGVVLACAKNYWNAALIRKWTLRLAPFSCLVIVTTIAICAYRATDASYLQSVYGRVFMFTLNGAALAALLPLVMNWDLPKIAAAPITFIARISYALYLVHWPFLFILNSAPQNLRFVLYAVATLVTATVLSFGIEQPLMRLRPSLKSKSTYVLK
jgi:peptidoglycan/LPS O-acetylase OafA/YrhL